MSSGIRQILLTLLLFLSYGNAISAEVDSSALLRDLVRPVPETVDFVEVRFSSLLTQALIVSGELERRADGALVRRVTSPYSETAILLGDNVTVVRDGQSARRFSLQRAPMLRVLVDGLGAILRGDQDTVYEAFTVVANEYPGYWSLVLKPKDARLGKQLLEVQLVGQGKDSSCLTLVERDGDATVMAIGLMMIDRLPSTVTRDALASACSAQQ